MNPFKAALLWLLTFFRATPYPEDEKMKSIATKYREFRCPHMTSKELVPRELFAAAMDEAKREYGDSGAAMLSSMLGRNKYGLPIHPRRCGAVVKVHPSTLVNYAGRGGRNLHLKCPECGKAFVVRRTAVEQGPRRLRRARKAV